jgi:Phage tail tube protein
MSGSLTKLGIGTEGANYGTAVAVTKPFEIISEDIRGTYPRLQAESLSSGYVDRSDRFVVNNKGARGTINMEPLTVGFANWLAFMMGTVVTTGPTESTVYTHTATMGNLTGKSLTVQILRYPSGGVVQPWTYEGGKVVSFDLSNSVDQTLRCSIGMDFELESNADAPAGVYTHTALAALTAPAGAQIFNWQGGYVSIGGAQVEVSEISVRVDNALNVDRYFISQSPAGKKEPVQDGKRMVEWSFKTPYVDNTYWEKVASATIAGTHATLVGRWSGLTLLGSTLYPTLEITIPVARFDEGGPVVEGPSFLDQTFTGRGLWDGTNSPVTIVAKSADVTVLGS